MLIQSLRMLSVSILLIHQVRRKRMWVRQLFLERKNKGLFNILVKDLMLFDHEYFFKSFRMTPERFERLLCWIAPWIHKSSRIRDVTGPASL